MVEALTGALLTGLAQGAMIALVALGYTMVYGVLKLINFAHSEVFMMGAYGGFFFMSWLGGKEHPLVAAVFGTLAAMAAAAALGILVERVAYRPLRERRNQRGDQGKGGNSRITPLVTALGVSVLLQNLAQLLFTARYRSYPQLFAHTRVVIFVVAIVVMGALQLLVYKPDRHRDARALGERRGRAPDGDSHRARHRVYVRGGVVVGCPGSGALLPRSISGLPDDGGRHWNSRLRGRGARRNWQHPGRPLRWRADRDYW